MQTQEPAQARYAAASLARVIVERVAGRGAQHVVAVDETVVNRKGKGLGVAQVREKEYERARTAKRGHDPVSDSIMPKR